jgi:hypothetical protein
MTGNAVWPMTGVVGHPDFDEVMTREEVASALYRLYSHKAPATSQRGNGSPVAKQPREAVKAGNLAKDASTSGTVRAPDWPDIPTNTHPHMYTHLHVYLCALLMDLAVCAWPSGIAIEESRPRVKPAASALLPSGVPGAAAPQYPRLPRLGRGGQSPQCQAGGHAQADRGRASGGSAEWVGPRGVHPTGRPCLPSSHMQPPHEHEADSRHVQARKRLPLAFLFRTAMETWLRMRAARAFRTWKLLVDDQQRVRPTRTHTIQHRSPLSDSAPCIWNHVSCRPLSFWRPRPLRRCASSGCIGG